MNRILLTLIIITFSICARAQEIPLAKPGLLVTPTRAILEGKNRSALISIANNGNASGVYRIKIVNKTMNESGQITKIEEGQEKPEDMVASEFLRISPRRVSIPAGGYQNVRILARKPKDLAEGEYRSHLQFIVVPEEIITEREKKNAERDSNQDEDKTLTISIKANFGVTIPIIVRHGNLSATASMNNLSLSKNEDTEHLNLTLHRDGDASLYGDFEINYYNKNGSKYLLKSMGGLAVYTSVDKRDFNIPLDIPGGVKLQGGYIEAIYREKEKDGGKTLASGKLNL